MTVLNSYSYSCFFCCLFVFLIFCFVCLFSLNSAGVFGMLSCSQLFILLMFWRMMLVKMTSYGWRVLTCLILLISKNWTGLLKSLLCCVSSVVSSFYGVVFLCCIALSLLYGVGEKSCSAKVCKTDFDFTSDWLGIWHLSSDWPKYFMSVSRTRANYYTQDKR